MSCEADEIEPIAPLNVSVIRKTTWALGFQILDPVTGVPINLTGATARMAIRDAAGNTALDLDENSGITVGTNTGFLDFEVSAAQTANLALQRHTYNLDVSVGSRTHAVSYGSIRVLDNSNLTNQ